MNFKQLFLLAPPSQLDPNLHYIIEKWSEPQPKAIEILELLDQVVHSGGGSNFVVSTLQVQLNLALNKESTNLEDLSKLATWRV